LLLWFICMHNFCVSVCVCSLLFMRIFIYVGRYICWGCFHYLYCPFILVHTYIYTDLTRIEFFASFSSFTLSPALIELYICGKLKTKWFEKHKGWKTRRVEFVCRQYISLFVDLFVFFLIRWTVSRKMFLLYNMIMTEIFTECFL